MFENLLTRITSGDQQALARAISLVENEAPGYFDWLKKLPVTDVKLIGITGPPGSGKSTLVDGLIEGLLQKNKKVGVLCVDPSSPFHQGALLGDRIRMNEWFTNPNVFIRSLSSKGRLGGLNPRTLAISEVMKVAGFDAILIETVGVGQNEVEIASLADTTVVVLVPESGDSMQAIKSGLLEVADIFVVNKCDRPGADIFIKNLSSAMARGFKKNENPIPIVKTNALLRKGIDHLLSELEKASTKEKKHAAGNRLFAQRAWYEIQRYCMKDLTVEMLEKEIENMPERKLNLYLFLEKYIRQEFK
ncbi:MAG: methylmalonyl Co-A mutase-associated GTPase MeaB [Bacteroidetes bacterium]|nr:methylmalonyl Co-A mutase-associated GTPase MeaB [Bacteroidota bacterium]